MEWGGIRSIYMPFKRKNSSQNRKNRAGSLKAAKKNLKLRAGDARSCVPGSTVVRQAPRAMVACGGSCPVRSPAFLNAAFWCMFGPCGLPWIICIGPVGLHFANLLDMVWAHLLHFLLTLRSICINLQSKPCVIGEIGA